MEDDTPPVQSLTVPARLAMLCDKVKKRQEVRGGVDFI